MREDGAILRSRPWGRRERCSTMIFRRSSHLEEGWQVDGTRSASAEARMIGAYTSIAKCPYRVQATTNAELQAAMSVQIYSG